MNLQEAGARLPLKSPCPVDLSWHVEGYCCFLGCALNRAQRVVSLCVAWGLQELDDVLASFRENAVFLTAAKRVLVADSFFSDLSHGADRDHVNCPRSGTNVHHQRILTSVSFPNHPGRVEET